MIPIPNTNTDAGSDVIRSNKSVQLQEYDSLISLMIKWLSSFGKKSILAYWKLGLE